jgi:hypothetical protein
MPRNNDFENSQARRDGASSQDYLTYNTIAPFPFQAGAIHNGIT